MEAINCLLHELIHRHQINWIDIQINKNKQVKRQIDRHKDVQTDGQISRHTNYHKKHKITKSQSSRHIDMNKKIGRLIHLHLDRWTDRQIDK